MMDTAIQLETEIRVFLDRNKDQMQLNNLTTDEWETIKEFVDILKPFRDVTEGLQSDKTTLDEILQSMDFLISHIKGKQEDYAGRPEVSASLLSMWFAFDKYYSLTDKTPAYAAALLLNPCLRKSHLHQAWRYLEEKEGWAGVVDRAVETVRRLWQKEYKFKPLVGEETIRKDPDLIKNAYDRWKYKQELERQSTGDEFEQFIAVGDEI